MTTFETLVKDENKNRVGIASQAFTAHITGTQAKKLNKYAVSAIVIAASIASANAKPVGYQLPDETITMKPGKNLEAFENNCTACHSSDYIKTQPQGPAFKTNFWQAEVTKMIKVYGAPIDEADVIKIVDYLSENY